MGWDKMKQNKIKWNESGVVKVKIKMKKKNHAHCQIENKNKK